MKSECIISQGGWWMINKTLVHKIGDRETILLTALIQRRDYLKKEEALSPDQYFYYGCRYIQKECTLTFYQQNRLLKRLVSLGLIEIQKRDLPTKNYYKINVKKINEIILSGSKPYQET